MIGVAAALLSTVLTVASPGPLPACDGADVGVTIGGDLPPDDIMQAIAAELALRGLSVCRGVTPPSVVTVGRDDLGALSVEVRGREPGATLRATMDEGATSPAQRPLAVAVLVDELLRALEAVRTGQSTPMVGTRPARPPDRWRPLVSLGARGLVYSDARLLGPQLEAGLRAGILRIGLRGAWLNGGDHQGTHGSVAVHSWLAGLRLALVQELSARWRTDLGAGADLQHVTLEGTAESNGVGARGSSRLGAFAAGAALSLRVTAALWLRGELEASVAARSVRALDAGTAVVSVGGGGLAGWLSLGWERP